MTPAPGRVALVTGSSRGLGKAIAQRLAGDGFAVAVNSLRSDAEAIEVARAIRDGGGVADTFLADVTDEQQVDELMAAIADGLGPVDVLVLNATGPQPEAPLIDVAHELAAYGITVNTVAPGFIPVERHADVSAEARHAYLASVPSGRMGSPQDIAHAVSFLASEGAGFITGQRIVVDGGRGLSS